MAMALGLGFSSPHAVAGHAGLLADHGRASFKGRRRRNLLLVQALGEEEAEITSVRDQTLSTLAKRFFNWGRDVHQQATRQMQKFFHELADGSLLVSFEEQPDSETRNNVRVPPRLPSRYSKQLPYAAKRTKQQEECLLQSNGRPLTKLPHREPSTFSKKSPINNVTRHRKGDAVGIHLLAFKDVELEDDAVGVESDMLKDENKELGAESNRHDMEDKKPRLTRPGTTFFRKSPIPETARRRRKSGKKAQEIKEPVNQDSAEKLKQPKLTRPRTAFSRKSPIPEPTRRSRKPQTLQEIDEAIKQDSIGADSTGDLEEFKIVSPKTTFSQESPISEGSKGSRKPSIPAQALNEAMQNSSDAGRKAEGSDRARPKGVFTRKSPIVQGKGGRRKQKSFQSPPTSHVVTLKQSSVVTEATPRPKGSFIRQSPIPHSRDGASKKKRRDRKKLPLSEEEIMRLASDAVKKAESESLQASESNVVAEVIVETPTNALSIKLGEEESMLLEVQHEQTTSQVLKTQENKELIEVVETKGKEQEDIPENRKNVLEEQSVVVHAQKVEIEERVESVETDVEFSEDESVSSSVDESDLSILTLQRLKRIAKSRGLRGYSRLRKAELIELLQKS